MEITPEIKKQLEAQKANCIFCKIISGEMEGTKVYEDDKMQGILDIRPAVKGHILLLPKEHYPIMPFLPPEDFKHIFGKLPQILKALKETTVRTGITVFIANGGVAGQQSPHFLIHALPREEGDGLDKYSFSEDKHVDKNQQQQINQVLAKNLPVMMANHFKRQPAAWHEGTGERPTHLDDIQQVLYEDELVVIASPPEPQALGHLIVYSKEANAIEDISSMGSSHLFYTASYGATAVFEGLKAQGSNIILKSGVSSDNPTGRLEVHILPRYENDGLDLMWTPQERADTSIAGPLNDAMFVVANTKDTLPKIYARLTFGSPKEEIEHAIKQIQES
ncbi:HIT domain-containing protein [Candidatus Woesearchaeota archaeon]|nr:HIT domain-containing protein [Candidatus Woesearchaeota archaeon]